MATMVERTCECGCGTKFKARTADVKRGWGRFLNKSHKAREQESRTGQHAKHQARVWHRALHDAVDSLNEEDEYELKEFHL